MKWVKTIQNIKKYITTKNNTGNVGIYVIYTYITWKLHIGCCWWQDTFTHFNIPETGMQLKIGSTACKFYYFVYVHDMCMKYKHAYTTMHACGPYDKSRESGLSFHPRIWGGNSSCLAYAVSVFIHWDFLSARMQKSAAFSWWQITKNYMFQVTAPSMKWNRVWQFILLMLRRKQVNSLVSLNHPSIHGRKHKQEKNHHYPLCVEQFLPSNPCLRQFPQQ